ncbi:double zinc ribbon domain-containing protein [Halolamina salifodinae]|uniref:Putative transcriptional regulator/RNA polymerase subunit RPABC4/transcription elongation factor Spt4 n=1 Tax=Halolamina salifodinae TaxID=1202767 RepID=A0A8T4GYB7_9EURY|nr:zinc ribbon domain-containing protein [Halolamina salifodinae]MBP1986355.1 putative transcriptional regulator/RNA polymerase subunit RPABC4/transcription elongation factor Spt4 [Halolamina salifodinae]
MSKITFRADDALVERLDGLDASKSEVMREALREFLDRHPSVDQEREVAAADGGAQGAEVSVEGGEDARSGLTVNINFDGVADAADAVADTAADADEESTCKQCGADVSADHSFCPNCGEEHRQPPHCECGEEIRPDWAFCPGCGRRSPTSEVFDRA